MLHFYERINDDDDDDGPAQLESLKYAYVINTVLTGIALEDILTFMHIMFIFIQAWIQIYLKSNIISKEFKMVTSFRNAIVRKHVAVIGTNDFIYADWVALILDSICIQNVVLYDTLIIVVAELLA